MAALPQSLVLIERMCKNLNQLKIARMCSGLTPTPCRFPESISPSQQAAHTEVFAQETLDYTGQKLNGSPAVESRQPGPGDKLNSSKISDAALPLPGTVQTTGNKAFQGTLHMGITLYREDILLNQHGHTAIMDSDHEAGKKRKAMIENKRLALP